MKIDEFDSLSDQEKLIFLWREGTLFSNFQIASHVWDTYKLENFYVSVCFSLTTCASAITYVSYQTKQAFQFVRRNLPIIELANDCM